MTDQTTAASQTTASLYPTEASMHLLPGYEPQVIPTLDEGEVVLTTNHARSSYGQPVLLWQGEAYGPADLPGLVLRTNATVSVPFFEAARLAGWTFAPSKHAGYAEHYVVLVDGLSEIGQINCAATIEDAERDVEGLRGLGESWADADYQIVPCGERGFTCYGCEHLPLR